MIIKNHYFGLVYAGGCLQEDAMQKHIMTITLACLLTIFMASTASAELMRYSGGGTVHSFSDGNPYGLDETTPVSWSVTYDTDWVDPFGSVDLGSYLDQGAGLTFNVGSWTFTHDQDSALFPGSPTVAVYNGLPWGFDFITDLGDDFDIWSQFHVIGNSFSFMSFWDDPAHGYFDFSKIAINPGAGAVPVPGAVWLLGTGLLALVGLRRKARS